jgi:protoporphyrinogen oxidase
MKIVIIGAGPCGLGAAQKLTAVGFKDWILLERHTYAGGLAASFTDDRGFTWDQGGHVIFSHYPEFDQMLEDTCGGDLLFHRRRSFVNVGNSLVPYPLQNNLRHLPRDQALAALSGLGHAPGGSPTMPFDQWLMSTFGDGLCRLFLQPYNQKVWATDLSRMSSQWVAERVSVVSFDRALRNLLVSDHDESDWGPNSTFVFPLRGGTGEIFRRLAARLPADNVHYNREVLRLDLRRKALKLQDGSSLNFDRLISTMPLDELVTRTEGLPDSLQESARDLRHSGTHAVGYGFEAALREDWCWMYFPEFDVPFNRVTNFARYSPFNVPAGRTDRYCSFMSETSFSDTKPEDKGRVAETTLRGLYKKGLIPGAVQPASVYTMQIPYAYPVPTLGRDGALRHIQPYLMQHGVFSRGRFGAWLYELGNMDHSYKQGIDIVDFILSGKEESEWKMR